MRYLLILVIAGFLGLSVSAQETGVTIDAAPDVLDVRDAADVTLAEFLWLNRLVVVFADTDLDPAFQEQMEFLLERPGELNERDVVVITDTDPANPSDIRLKLRPRGFGFVLIDKDGGVKLRKPTPWDVREISRSIDKTPLRRQEMRDSGGAG
ncbi:MAG: DUF4174 domain-containing protein [Paracoccaceae bacterium]